jgi:hypothetical protein
MKSRLPALFVISAASMCFLALLFVLAHRGVQRYVELDYTNENARENWQKGNHLEAMKEFTYVYERGLSGELRWLVSRPFIWQMNRLGDENLNRQLRLCRLANTIMSGRYDPEGIIGNRCAGIELTILLRNCELNCNGECRWVDGEFVCKDIKD